MEVENLIQDLACMMRSGDASDLKFVCKGKEFNVHKFMVYARSTFLRIIVLRGFWVCLQFWNWRPAEKIH